MERIEKLNTMLEQFPKDCFLRHALALEWAKLGDYSKARSYFEQVLALDPNYIGTYYHLGKALEKLGFPAEATGIYEEGIKRAGLLKDNHARNELQQALDDLNDD